MKSKDPAYYKSNLSRAIERPNPGHPLYSALHGPPANDQDIVYVSYGNTLQWRVRQTKSVKNWKVPGALYLYHGKRECMNNEDLKNHELFSFDRDASRVNRDHHQREFDSYDGTIRGAVNCLRENLKTLGMPEIPVKTLLARDIVRNAGGPN